MECFKNFKIWQVSTFYTKSDDEVDHWLRELGLLYKSRSCACGDEMRIVSDDSKQYQHWRCDQCCKRIDYLAGTWFAGADLSLKQVMAFGVYWAMQLATVNLICQNIQLRDGKRLSSDTILKWRSCYREMCVNYFLNNSVKVGGQGKVVAIAETVFKSRTEKKGDQWFFGGVERGSNKVFVVPVVSRDTATLFPIIQKYVRPGTVIISKGKSYVGIGDLPEGYFHLVDNNTKSNDEIEESMNLWEKVEQLRKGDFGREWKRDADYIFEFAWMKKFGGHDAVYHLFSQIQDLYCQDENGFENE